MAVLSRSFFARPALEVAADLVGATLVHRAPFGTLGGVIVEVEAYGGAEDAASHAKNGPTPRNRSMFGPPGHAYVYRSYGIHWCLNFVCEKEGSASAVLIRALEPTDGLAKMRRRRGLSAPRAARLHRQLDEGRPFALAVGRPEAFRLVRAAAYARALVVSLDQRARRALALEQPRHSLIPRRPLQP